MDERLKRLVARREQASKEREQLLAKRKAIVDLADEEKRDDLTDEEDAEFRKLTEDIKGKDEELSAFDERINELAEEARRNTEIERSTARMRRAMTEVEVSSEARTYDRGNGRSYFQDLVRVSMGVDGSGEARSRLQRHAEEVATDKEFRALDRTDGSGGYFVPPLWLVSQAAELARAGRATANVVTNQPLPPGTDSINIPKVASGAETAIQDGDNTAIADTDVTDDFVNAPVRTIAGQQDIALQLIDQSPVNFDEVIFRDLVADLATKVDLQVIGGTGSNGQVLGVRNTADIETVTYTSGTPTVAEVYPKLADAVQRVHTLRFQPPSVIVMHPRRWAWMLAALDGQSRPLFLPGAGMPQNAMGTLSAVASEQVVGQMHGLPVVTDPNLPTALGAGTNEDVVLVLRASDLLLWESGVRTRSYPTPTSGIGSPSTLTVRIEVYEYLAFTAGRYPKSVVELGGTGLVAPTFGS